MEVLNLVVCAALVLGVCVLFLLPPRTRSRRPPPHPESRERRDAAIPRHALVPRRRTPDDDN